MKEQLMSVLQSLRIASGRISREIDAGIKPFDTILEGAVGDIDRAVDRLGTILLNEALPPSDRVTIAPASVIAQACIEAVSLLSHVSVADIIGPRRHRSVAIPRHAVVLAIRTLTTLALADIGMQIGGRDHSTVLHAYNRTMACPVRKELAQRVIETVRARYTEAANGTTA